MKPYVLLSTALAALLSAPSFAGTPIGTYPATATTTAGTSSSTTRTDTRAYAGLSWTIGGGYTPALVLGVTNTRVKSNGDTTGARLAFHINLAGGIAPSLLKLSYLNGKEDFQGEIGAGYNFIKSAPLLGIGISAPYISAGVDGYLNPSFVPYATLTSQGAFKKPNAISTPGSTVYSCDLGDTLLPPSTCQSSAPL